MVTPTRRVFGEPVQLDQTNTRVAPAGVGAPDQDVTSQALGANDQLRKFAGNQIKEAEEMQVLNLSNQVDELKSNIERDIKSKKGRNALDVEEESDEALTEGLSKIESQAVGTTQNLAFERMRQTSEHHVNQTAKNHRSSQEEVVKDQEFAAKSKNLIESSLLNWDNKDRQVDNTVDFMNLSIREAERQGFEDESLEAFMFSRMSAYHKSVFDKMIAEDDPELAESYLDFYDNDMGHISPSVVDVMNKSLEEANFRGNAQSITDDIMDSRNGVSFTSDDTTWTEKFSLAREIKDPELRDEVTNRLKSRRNLENSLESEAKDEIFQRATLAIEENPTASIRDSVPIAEWNKLSPSDKQALKRHQSFSDPKSNMSTDWNAFFKFYGLKPEERAKLSEREFRTKYWSRLDPQSRNKIFNEWQKNIGDTSNSKKTSLKGILSAEDHMNNELREIGWLIPGKSIKGADALRNQRLVASFDEWLIDARNKEGEPTKEAIEKQVRKLSTQSFRVDGDEFGRFDLSREKVKENLNQGTLNVSLSEARGGLSEKNFNFISNLVRGEGQVDPGTSEFRAKVRRLGAAFRAGDMETFEKILSGRIK